MIQIAVVGTRGKTTAAVVLDRILRSAGWRTSVLADPAGQDDPGGPVRPWQQDAVLSARSAAEAGRADALVIELGPRDLLNGVVVPAATRAVLAPSLRTEQDIDAVEAWLAFAAPQPLLVLPFDDPPTARLALRYRGRVRGFGEGHGRTYGYETVLATLEGSEILIHNRVAPISAECRLIGRHQVPSVVAAAACAAELGVGRDAIRAGIDAVEPLPGRTEPVSPGFPAVFEAAVTPQAVRSALKAARRILGTGGLLVAALRLPAGTPRLVARSMAHVLSVEADIAAVAADWEEERPPSVVVADAAAAMTGPADRILRSLWYQCLTAACRRVGPGDAIVVISPDGARADRDAFAEAIKGSPALVGGSCA